MVSFTSKPIPELAPMENSQSVVQDDFASMDDDTLAAAVSTLAAHIHAATCRLPCSSASSTGAKCGPLRARCPVRTG